MREKLIQYVDLLFAGIQNAEDIKAEILQNTLDRFDDLVAQGKTPEAAYSLAISGIGDLSEILSSRNASQAQSVPMPAQTSAEEAVPSSIEKALRAVAIALYILCPVPLFLLQNELGLCGLLGMVAVATALIVFARRQTVTATAPASKKQRVLMGINVTLWIIAIVLYGNVSSLTEAWYITWVIFPATACITGIIKSFFYIREHTARSIICIIILIVVLAILGVVLFGGLYAVNIHDWNETVNTGFSSDPVLLDSNDIENIRIEWVLGNISIIPGEGNQITVRETGAETAEDAFVVKQQGRTLTIQYCSQKVSFGLFHDTIGSKDLTLTFPKDWYCNKLTVDSVSAAIGIESITAKDIEIVNVSGSCSFVDCQVSDFDADTVSGEVTYSGVAESLDFNTVSADCTAIFTNIPKSVEIDSVSGDTELVMPGEAGYRLEWDSASGDFRCDYSGNSHTFGDLGCEITADTVSGDMILKKAQ